MQLFVLKKSSQKPTAAAVPGPSPSFASTLLSLLMMDIFLTTKIIQPRNTRGSLVVTPLRNAITLFNERKSTPNSESFR